MRQLGLVQKRLKELAQYDNLPKNSDWYVYLQKKSSNITIRKKSGQGIAIIKFVKTYIEEKSNGHGF